jgi:hypothetical protein
VKFVISLVVIVGLALGARLFYQYYESFQPKPAEPAAAAAPAEVPEDQLPGMPESLQPALQEAREHGAPGLRGFLAAHGQAISDPRLAALELDYVILVTPSNPAEACRIFARVKGRLEPTSPVYARVKKLEKTYE